MTDELVMPELKRCPFCGGDAIQSQIEDSDSPDSGGYFIQCTEKSCGTSSALIFACGDDPIPLLIERWNRRAFAPDPDDAGQVRAIVSEIETLSWTVESVDEITITGAKAIAVAILTMQRDAMTKP